MDEIMLNWSKRKEESRERRKKIRKTSLMQKRTRGGITMLNNQRTQRHTIKHMVVSKGLFSELQIKKQKNNTYNLN